LFLETTCRWSRCWKAAQRRWAATHKCVFYQSHSAQRLYILYLSLSKLQRTFQNPRQSTVGTGHFYL